MSRLNVPVLRAQVSSACVHPSLSLSPRGRRRFVCTDALAQMLLRRCSCADALVQMRVCWVVVPLAPQGGSRAKSAAGATKAASHLLPFAQAHLRPAFDTVRKWCGGGWRWCWGRRRVGGGSRRRKRVGGRCSHTVAPSSCELLRQHPSRLSTHGRAAHRHGSRWHSPQHERRQRVQRGDGRRGRHARALRALRAPYHALHPRLARNPELNALVPSAGLAVSLLPASAGWCTVLAVARTRLTCAQGKGRGNTSPAECAVRHSVAVSGVARCRRPATPCRQHAERCAKRET